MKKWIVLLFVALLMPSFFIYGWFSLTTGEHHYSRTDIFSYWLYTPTSLRQAPAISENAEYRYIYDPDSQHMTVTILWKNIGNRVLQKAQLIDFIQKQGGFEQYDCVWRYYDEKDYTDNYRRYCVFQKSETLELEYFETERRISTVQKISEID